MQFFASRLAAVTLAVCLLTAGSAAAVPAFAVQTGEPCQACHVGGFGPQLTPFGREFKLQGYTLRTKDWNMPLSAMLVASYLHTAKAQDPQPGFSGNDNGALDQLSLFFAAGFGEHFGAFIQGTYDGVGKAWSWDNLDLRAVDSFKVKDANVTLGLSLNNSPSVQDAWNTLPAWGYPYTSSGLAPGGSASPLLNGALAQTSLGLTGYAWVNSMVYVEGGAYWSPGAKTLANLGADPTSPGSISGAAPYVRVALQHDLGPGTAELGAFGMESRINPGLDQTSGFTDQYIDAGVDGSYVVTLKNDDVVTFNARYMHESQSLAATCALAGGPAGCEANGLEEVRLDGSYYWRNKVGLTVAYFSDTGSENDTLYADNRTARPDTSGVTFQIDGTPWGDGKGPLGARFNARIGLQYTAFTQFNGAATNYDGAGANASDNNTLRVFVWAAY